ncbi:MAG TPA: CHAP domain-containing protein [Acidimicrobiales bacterium]|nr:CHAP domain-containing protein [Acidimicrobiales bacterium]
MSQLVPKSPIPSALRRRRQRRWPKVAGGLCMTAAALMLPAVLSSPPVNAAGTAPAISSTGSSLPVVAVQGPSNSLWIYWQLADGAWIGPAGPGGPDSTFSSPAVAVTPSGLGVVAVQGPSHSLWIYWQIPDGAWIGPAGPGGPGTTFGSPAIAVGSSGLPVVTAQGPSNTLYSYWELADGQWAGPSQIGDVGTTYSSPAMAVDSSGLPVAAVQGPGNSMWVYTEGSDGQWTTDMGAASIGSTYSSPSLASGPRGLLEAAVEGPSNTLWIYWKWPGGSWNGPAGPGGPGSTLSSPSITIGPDGVANVAVQGPGDSLWIYWQPGEDAAWYGPAGAGSPGSTFSSPSVTSAPYGPVASVEGPSNSLWIYWYTTQGWIGPAGPGAPGSDNPSTDPGTSNVTPAPPSALGDTIAQIAAAQDGTADNPPSTSFGFDCNPYTAVLYAGMENPACGTNSYFGVRNANEEWCADFAKLVWISAGVSSDVGTLSPSAATFYAWGAQQGEPLAVDGGNPQVGDAIVFYPPGSAGGSFADHVGVVSAVNPDGTVDIVNGDFLNGSNITVEQDDDVLPGPYASDIFTPGEQWVYVAP